VAPLDHAGASDIGFLDNIRYREQFEKTKAGACIVAPEMIKYAPKGMALLLSKNPYKSYALVAQAFYPDFPQGDFRKPELNATRGLHIHPEAKISKDCILENGAVIAAGASVGEGSWIGANAVIGENVVIGKYCRIGANAVISHAVIGDHVRIYPGA